MHYKLKLTKKSPKIILPSVGCFEKINMLSVVNSNLNQSKAPFGLRWSLINNNNQYNCFNWQMPEERDFNCFEVMSCFNFIASEFSNKNISGNSELHISIESEVVDEDSIIDIELDIDSSNREQM